MNLHKALIASEIFGDAGSGGGGSSDFSTVEVTIVNNIVSEVWGFQTGLSFSPIMIDGDSLQCYVVDLTAGNSVTKEMVLYSGEQVIGITQAEHSNMHVEVTGDIDVDDNDTNEPYIFIHGDGAVTVTLAS